MKYYEDDQFHWDEVVMACSPNEGAEKCIKRFGRKTWTDKIATVSIKENNIKVQLKCDGGDVTRLAEDTDWYWDAVVHPLLPWKSNDCYILWVCLYTWVFSTQCACAILSSVVCLVYSSFSHYLTNGTLFVGGGWILNINCVLRFWCSCDRASLTWNDLWDQLDATIVIGLLINHKLVSQIISCVLKFSLQLLSETFFVLERSARDMIMNVPVQYLL